MTDRDHIARTAREIKELLMASIGFEMGQSWEAIIRSKIKTMLKRMRAKK